MAPPGPTLGWCKRWLLLASGVVVLLLTAHVALMASMRHEQVMPPLYEQFAATATMPLAVPVAMHVASQTPAPGPLHLMGDCPGQAAVMPLLLLLLALVGMGIGASGTPRRAVTNHLGSRFATSILLPVAAHRRRALLQVYLN